MKKGAMLGEKLRGGATGFARGAETLRAELKTMPQKPGVYRMLAGDGTVLYVGKAKNLKNRVTSYTQIARLPLRLQRMVAQVRGLEVVVTGSEAEALLLEGNLIQHFMPPFNVLLRDDKSYPYLLLTGDHPFPQLLKHRGAHSKKGDYFGPFASSGAASATQELLQKGFMLRTCSDSVFAHRTRPCLQYHIKRCTAPCVGKVSEEAYAQQVAEARAFLSGKSQEIQKQLASRMRTASDALDFETAGKLRDRIKALTAVQAHQGIFVPGLGDADIWALAQKAGQSALQVFFYRADRNYGTRSFFPAHDQDEKSGALFSIFLAQFYAGNPPPPLVLLSEKIGEAALLAAALSAKAGRKVRVLCPEKGDKKGLTDDALANAESALARHLAEGAAQERLLKGVAELFHLPKPPRRIEVYDNSHTGGQQAIGAMIAAGPEGFLKKTYRQFVIKEADGRDDYGMMREVLTRRFKRLLSEDPARATGLWPDLLLIDGGRGQTDKVRAVLAELGVKDVAVVGIAKGPDRNAGRERFFLEGQDPFDLPHDDPVLYYLQRLRDEAHRFAIGTHRARRAKAISVSGLEAIEGIGAVRKRALLNHFGSGKAVAAAGREDLTRVPGISPSAAKKIYDFFHGKG